MPFGFIPIDYGYFQAILAQQEKGYAKDSHLGIPFFIVSTLNIANCA